MTSKLFYWLAVFNMGVQARFLKGIFEKLDKPKLISDNGCQPTFNLFMKACSELTIK